MTSLALIGLGAVVRNIHMPAYARLKDQVRVVAGCDPNPAAREHARSQWNLQVFEDPQAMIDAVKPDVVVICTPPWLHREQAILALERGCHVFCEKPLADNLSDADDIIRASEKTGRRVVVNNQFPAMNIHTAAKQQIGTPQFGKLLYVHAWHTMRTNEVTEAGWRGKISRRLCFEFGIHIFELVRFFFEETPVRLLAHMPNPLGRATCDVINVLTMEFADGRGACIILDRVSLGPERYLDMRLDGEHSIVHTSIGGQVQLAAGLHTHERRPFVELSLVKGGKAVLQQGTRSKLLATDGINPFASSTASHFSSFLDAIRTGGNAPGDIRDNRNTLAMVMAAYDSASEGKWVEMSRYLEPAVNV